MADSSLWHGLNPGGSTVFLEHAQKWIDEVREKQGCRDCDIRATSYWTQLGPEEWIRPKEWNPLRCDSRCKSRLLMRDVLSWSVLPFGRVAPEPPSSDTENHPPLRWDLIIVDAPRGYGILEGRMQSIITASFIAHPGTHIFVHDCERPLEDEWSSTFLCPPRCRDGCPQVPPLNASAARYVGEAELEKADMPLEVLAGLALDCGNAGEGGDFMFLEESHKLRHWVRR
jgi:glucuronoxylan 4-O-methyltransferase